METVAESRARKAQEDANKEKVKAKLDAQAKQGSKETTERLDKEKKLGKV